eukprot:TRINITY_DN13778_c0_g1_i1.p1 TRINITY_DN13778_c0_g1~~TRINITY_DN13778_c0_g1_i1.p1  ORF type:complete len:225 (-),score=33.00 TRINITY_DN13778_c0_g1_i1:99-773(-)
MSGQVSEDTVKAKLFFEHQEELTATCAVHCVNNLLQGPFTDAGTMAEVAQSLDRQERMLRSNDRTLQREKSHNVDDTGFFSVEVVLASLRQMGCDMTPLASEEGQILQSYPEQISGAVINRGQHWLAARKFGGVSSNVWIVMNSMTQMEMVQTKDLMKTLRGFVDKGNTVYLTPNDLPSCDVDTYVARCLPFSGMGRTASNESSSRQLSAAEMRLKRMAALGGG